MLHVAALALERGAGFQWGSQVCAADRRSGPFCLFRPVSACGKAPIAACTNPMRLGVGGAACFDWGLGPNVLPAVNTSPPWADEAPLSLVDPSRPVDLPTPRLSPTPPPLPPLPPLAETRCQPFACRHLPFRRWSTGPTGRASVACSSDDRPAEARCTPASSQSLRCGGC